MPTTMIKGEEKNLMPTTTIKGEKNLTVLIISLYFYLIFLRQFTFTILNCRTWE